MSGTMQEKRTEVRGKEMLLKAISLHSIEEIPKIQEEFRNRTIIILKMTPLRQKSLEELKTAVQQLFEFATSMGGDIARLGDERVVMTPPGVRIWRGGLQ
jgi:uncharacterized protein